MDATARLTNSQREATARFHDRLAALNVKYRPAVALSDNQCHAEAARRLRADRHSGR